MFTYRLDSIFAKKVLLKWGRFELRWQVSLLRLGLPSMKGEVALSSETPCEYQGQIHLAIR